MESQRDPRYADLVPWSPAVPRVRDAPPATGDMPIAIAVAAGAVAVVAAAVTAAVLPMSAGALRLGVMAIALTVFAATTADPRAVAAVTALGWLVFDGFLVNRFGDLTWTGRLDEWRLGVLVAGAVVGLAAGVLRRWAQLRWGDAEVAAPADGPADPPIDVTQGEGRRAGSGVRAGDNRVVSGIGPDGAGGEQALSAISQRSQPHRRDRTVAL
jgi:hypothetical protein